MGAYLLYLVFFFALFFGLPIYLLVRGIRDPRGDWQARAHHAAPYSVIREPSEAELRAHRSRLWVGVVIWTGLGVTMAAVTLYYLLSRQSDRGSL